MLRNKYKIDLHSADNTTLLADLTAMAARHNDNKVRIDLDVFDGYIRGYAVRYEHDIKVVHEGIYLEVSYYGKPFVTIHENTVEELITEPENN